MSRPRIAIATCVDYADLKVDDELLREELGARGAEATSIVWGREGSELDGFDACIVRSTWDYHEKHEEFLAWTRQVEAAMPLTRILARHDAMLQPFLPSLESQGELSLIYIDGHYSTRSASAPPPATSASNPSGAAPSNQPKPPPSN